MKRNEWRRWFFSQPPHIVLEVQKIAFAMLLAGLLLGLCIGGVVASI